MNGWLIGKVPDAGKNWGQKEKRASKDEVARPMQRTWTWTHFRPGLLRSTASQRVGHDWANWTTTAELTIYVNLLVLICYSKSITSNLNDCVYIGLDLFPLKILCTLRYTNVDHQVIILVVICLHYFTLYFAKPTLKSGHLCHTHIFLLLMVQI